MSDFCLKQGQDRSGFKALGGTPLPKLPLNASKGDQSLSISAIKPK